MKKLSIEVLEEKAKTITRNELKSYFIPKNINPENLFLEIKFDGDIRIFELYCSNDGNINADVLIARTRLNVFTGQGAVEVFLAHKGTRSKE